MLFSPVIWYNRHDNVKMFSITKEEKQLKKLVTVVLCLLLVGMIAVSVGAQESQELIGTGKGFGGDLVVKVTKVGDKITAVEVIQHSETPGIGTPALANIP